MNRIILVSLLFCSTSLPAFAQTFPVRNGLPPTSMDSFVHEAAGSADLIYGDEGKWDIPPYDEFTVPHRINSGIFGVRDAGITTGHGSYMPDAWGGDEWTGNEWSQSGANNGVPTGQTMQSPATKNETGALDPTSITGLPQTPGGAMPPTSTGQGGEGNTNIYMSPGSNVTSAPNDPTAGNPVGANGSQGCGCGCGPSQ
jgi:hypothetical protein